MNHLTISLLGPFQAALDGETIARFGVKTAQALLAYLALHAETPCRRETLAGLLWPDQPEQSALTNLRQTLSWLRRAIGDREAAPPFLHITRETIQLNPESEYWLDVSGFTELNAACAVHWHRHIETCAPCAQRLERAAALYRGDFLSGFSLPSALFEEWMVTERGRLHGQALDVLRDLAAYHEHRVEYEQTIDYARRQVEMEPWREEAHRQLMRALALDGQRGAALAQYEICRRTLMAELGIEPAEETTALHRDIRNGAAIHAPSLLGPHNLPASLTPFVGRETELREVAGRLQDPNCRLLTLVGPGGIGKTRLALEAAREQLPNFEHGVFYVSLAPLRSADAIVAAVAQACGLAFHGAGDLQRQLIDYLRRKQTLLVLDNFEHLLDCAYATMGTSVDLVGEILRAAPGVKVVVTSRARLNARGEHLFHVVGMDYPEKQLETKTSDLSQYSSVKLFVQGVRQVREGFEPTVDDLAHVARICRLVEGMPLAIRLAATWGEMLSPAEIATEIDRGIAFLEANWRGAAERHRSLRAVFDSAWEMLTGDEREVFARLSVFQSGFTAEAAAAVTGADLRTLRALVYKSFLQRDPDGRFSAHELLRQYAEAQLGETPAEREKALDLHSAYYADFLATRETEIYYRGSPEAVLEIDNIRAAWRRAVQRCRIGDIRRFVGRSMGGLCALYEAQGWHQEGEAVYRKAVEALRGYEPVGENGVALGVALRAQGWFSALIADYDTAAQLLGESTALLRVLGAWQEFVLSNNAAAWTGVQTGGTEAERLFGESLAISREIGFQHGMSWTLDLLAAIDMRHHRYQKAEQRTRKALQIAREIGNCRGVAWCVSSLAHLAHARGEYVEARQLYKEAVVLFQETGNYHSIGPHLNALGDVALALGERDEARATCREALDRARDLGDGYAIGDALANLGTVLLDARDVAEAKEHYRQALDIAVERQEARLSVRVLVALANWRAHSGERERAVELLAQALSQRTLFGWIEYPARGHLEALRAELSPAVFAAAQARGCARDVQATLIELLAELDDTQGDGITAWSQTSS